jgi:hypothetical protein
MLVAATQYSERIPADEEDLELSTASSDGESPKKWAALKLGVAGIGLAVLAIATAAYVVGGARESELDKAPINSARALMESPEMANTIKGNYMKLTPELKAKDEEMLKRIQVGMKRLMKHMKEMSPKAHEQLDQLSLSDGQKRGILQVVGSLGDGRLQAVGKEIAKMGKDSKIQGKNTFSQEAMKRKLAQSFEQNKTKLVQLRNELVPAALRQMLDKDWDVTFDAEKTRLVRTSKDSWDVEMAMDRPTSRRLVDTSDEWGSSSSSSGGDITKTAPGSTLTSDSFDGMGSKFEEGLGVFSGLLEQARVALDQIDFVGESFDVDMKIPYWAKSLVGGLDFVGELSDCVMRGESNEVKLMMCPMKYASAATDFLESIDNVMGVNNGHFFSGGSTTQPYMQYQQQPQQYAPQQPQQYQQPTQGYVPQGSKATWR